MEQNRDDDNEEAMLPTEVQLHQEEEQETTTATTKQPYLLAPLEAIESATTKVNNNVNAIINSLAADPQPHTVETP